MCIKTIYHNTYADGHKDISERVETCTPGYMCAHPRIREADRLIGVTKLPLSSSRDNAATLADRKPTPYYAEDRHVRPPTPRSMSPPGSRGSDSKREYRKSGTYVNGVKVMNPSRRDSRRDRERPIVHESSRHHTPHAPEPPSPRPIPIPRASTMPYGLETPPERGRRPIIVEERAPRHMSSTVPIGPVEVLEHASRRRLSRRDSHLLSAPGRRHSRSPQGYASAEDERERHERHRKRRELRAQASTMPSSMPTFGNTDIYGTSPYGSSYGSSRGSSSYASRSPNRDRVSTSPAAAAVKKELRWEDQQRQEQNARISSRPKLSRAATLNAGLHGEVKSILKNPAEPRKLADGDLNELYRSVSSMGIHGGERESSKDRRSRELRDREDKEYAEYKDRLRNRFSMPPRRFTAGTGSKRRSEVWYPDEGRYKYV